MPRLSPDELAHRRSGMGSTDIVEALGLAPWDGAGPMRVYLAKTTDAPDATDDDRGELEWGHVMEPVILEWYQRTMGVTVLPGGPVHHREHPWIWATLDGTVVDADKNVEVKNVGSQMAHHWDAYEDDGVPRYVRAQCVIGMACSGKRACDVVAAVAGRPPHVWTVGWDAELWQLLVDGARGFWAMVQKGEAPPLDATPASKEYLRQRYPSNVDRVIVEADDATDDLGMERVELAGIIERAEARKSVIDAEIMERIGTHGGAQGSGWKMTWKLDKNGVRRQRFTGPRS